MNEDIGHRILHTASRLAGCGPRWMGSDGERRARQCIVEALEERGLAVTCQAFTYLAYTDHSATFAVDGRPLACEPLAYSAATATEFTAPLVYIGEGRPEDIARLSSTGVDIRRSIVLSDNLRSFVAYPAAESAGALAFVLATTLPGHTIRCGTVRFDRKPGTIPALSIGGDDSRRIITALKQGAACQATLKTGGRTLWRTGQNVVGTTAANFSGQDRILLSAHYDSFWNGIHAMDNLAGVATLIELAGTLPSTLASTLEFVFFAGEELGSWGAAGYVAQPGFDPGRIRTLINLDAFGSRVSELEVGVTGELSGLCREAAAATGVRVDHWRTPPREASDHKEFLPFGVPCVWLANNGTDKAYHTPLDCIAHMSADKLSDAFTLSASIARLVFQRNEAHLR